MARTLRCAVGDMYVTEGENHRPLLPWLFAHATGQIVRCQIGPEGRTPRKRRHGRRFKKALHFLAESIMYLPAGDTPSRLHDKWKEGLFLGVVGRSSEFEVGAGMGTLCQAPPESRANGLRFAREGRRRPVAASPGRPLPTVISVDPVARFIWPTSTEIRLYSATLGPRSARVCRMWPNLDRIWPPLTELDQIWAGVVKIWPTSAAFGRFRIDLDRFDRPNLVRTRPNLAELEPLTAKLFQVAAGFRIRPNLAEVEQLWAKLLPVVAVLGQT